jgi:tRNA threonylcarbamoyladenosine biosynthesis protein TsaE
MSITTTFYQTISRDEARTRALGRAVGEAAAPGDTYLLLGELGAGKTTFTQGVLWGLGLPDHARSPTFVLVGEYHGRLTLYHMDLYRIESVGSLEDIGVDEYIYGDGVCVIEWADRAASLFPSDSMTISFERLDDTTRRISFATPAPEQYERVLAAVRSASADAA